VRRLAGAVPPSGVSGAAFYRGRLLLAGATGYQGRIIQVWSVDLADGSRRLELERRGVRGESEGLAQVPLLGARLHYLVAPLAAQPSFGPTVGILHFVPGRWPQRGLHVRLRGSRQQTLRPRLTVTVWHAGRLVRGAVVHVAGRRARTNRRGRAFLRPRLGVSGSFAALANKGRRRGRSRFLRFGPVSATPARRTAPAG
jgi:hypothetical protein